MTAATTQPDAADLLQRLDLPPTDDLIVSVDTEGSGLHVDDGARLSVVTLAWRDDDGRIQDRIYPFDQGAYTWLGPKGDLPRSFMPDLFMVDVNLGLDEWQALCGWLQRQSLVWHNCKHDLHQFAAGLRTMPETGVDLSPATVWDTQTAAALLWPLDSPGLKSTAARLWSESERDAETRLKDWLKRHGKRYDLAPWDLLEPYARHDAVLTLRLYETEQAAVNAGEIAASLIDRKIDLSLVLFQMERRGVGYDAAQSLQIGAQLQARARQVERQLAGIIGTRHPTEHTMRKWWFGAEPQGLGLRPISTTEKGEPQVTLPVVRTLVEREVPGAVEWQELSKLNTAASMWYEGWAALCGADGRLRCNYWPTKVDNRGTRSGRLSVERVQLQAIPHDYQLPAGVPTVRSLFRPRDGHALYELDLSQAEMRVAAGVSGCVALTEAFAAGEDAHDTTTRLMFDIEDGDPDWNQRRSISKRLNFGMIYGAGVDTLRQQIVEYTGQQPDRELVREWKEQFGQIYPELKQASRMAQLQAERNRFVPLVGGMKRWFQPYEYEHKAFNAKIQGGVSQGMEFAMIDVELQHPGILLLQIHDSLVVEVPVDERERVDEVASIMVKHFERLFGVAFRADAKEWK